MNVLKPVDSVESHIEGVDILPVLWRVSKQHFNFYFVHFGDHVVVYSEIVSKVPMKWLYD